MGIKLHVQQRPEQDSFETDLASTLDGLDLGFSLRDEQIEVLKRYVRPLIVWRLPHWLISFPEKCVTLFFVLIGPSTIHSADTVWKTTVVSTPRNEYN